MMLTCNPVPFEDPKPNVEELVSQMTARINGEEALIKLEATEYEKKATQIKRFAAKGSYDLETALNEWKDWVEWRHDIAVDKIEEEEIAFEKQEGILAWRGQNKDKMKCCVITGRNLDPINRTGTHRSFKRYFIKTMEDGLKAVDEDEQDQVCFIYDRRGLEFKHIDPNLFTFCKKVAEEMRDFYKDRIGVIYVLHVNFFFWLLYTIIAQPLIGLISSDFNKKFVLVDKPEDLLKYFNEEDLLLSRFEDPDNAAASSQGVTATGDAAESAVVAGSGTETGEAPVVTAAQPDGMYR